MRKTARSRISVRVRGTLALVIGVVVLVLVRTRAHIVFSSQPIAGKSAAHGFPFTALPDAALPLVAQIGLLLILSLIGIIIAGHGLQLCLGGEKESAKS